MEAKRYEELLKKLQEGISAAGEASGALIEELLKAPSTEPLAEPVAAALTALAPVASQLSLAMADARKLPASIAPPPPPALARGALVSVKPDHFKRYAVSLGRTPGPYEVSEVSGPLVRVRVASGEALLLAAHVSVYQPAPN